MDHSVQPPRGSALHIDSIKTLQVLVDQRGLLTSVESKCVLLSLDECHSNQTCIAQRTLILHRRLWPSLDQVVVPSCGHRNFDLRKSFSHDVLQRCRVGDACRCDLACLELLCLRVAIFLFFISDTGYGSSRHNRPIQFGRRNMGQIWCHRCTKFPLDPLDFQVFLDRNFFTLGAAGAKLQFRRPASQVQRENTRA